MDRDSCQYDRICMTGDSHRWRLFRLARDEAQHLRLAWRVCLALSVCAAVILALIVVHPLRAGEDSSALRGEFAQPPRDYSTGPLWTWNDRLTQEQIVWTLQQLAAQHVRQVWVHPQPGLMTPYLSDEWFQLWETALREAKRLDMNIWMYDENSYPSGFAGGYVPQTMPESRGRGLHFREEQSPGPATPDVLAVFQQTDDRFVNVTQQVRSGEVTGEGTYLKAVVARAPNTPWNAGRSYVDLLYPGVTERFLEITLEPYRQRFGGDFGGQIPGVFTDEPSILPAGGLPWTDDLPEQFQRRWGYPLIDHLPSLVRDVGDWRRVRHNYFQVLLDLYIARWAQPYYEYCERNKLELTGHYLEHEWPRLVHTPDFMAMEAWEHRPGIDILLNKYEELPHAQFGNVRIVKEIASVAHQMGRRRTLSETYAGSGHEIRFEEMKRQGDWQLVLGLNTLNECLSHVTIRGVRKGNWPRTLSYHNPWWPAYHELADYFTRLSAAMSHGNQVNRILVLEPTTTAWMYQNDARLEEMGVAFQALLNGLERAQVEYDLGSEDILARHGSVEGRNLVVGHARYEVVVLPPSTEQLNAKTVELLEEFLQAGSPVYCCGPPPLRVDGAESPRASNLAQSPTFKPINESVLAETLLSQSQDGFVIERQKDDQGKLFHQRRQFDDGELLLLVNTDMENSSAGAIRCRAGGVQQWSLSTGAIEPFPFAAAAQGIEARFALPPCGSLLLFLTKEPIKSIPPRPSAISSIEPVSAPLVRRTEDNVLVLDYLEWRTADHVTGLLHCREATAQLFKRNGFQGNPWFEAVQFADEHVSREFSPDTAFEVTYRFTVAQTVPKHLELVVERPDLYGSISCNGVVVAPTANAWWLDRSFGRIDISQAAQAGENTVTLKADRFSVFHELEPAYVLGDFSLQAAQRGFAIVPETSLQMIADKGWNAQGCPFYGAGVGYEEEFEVPDPRDRYLVELTQWLGSVAEVTVNGKSAGYIGWRPWECDITDLIKPGRNHVEVIVFGTLRNTLGPFHAGPPQGIVTPHMFNQAPPGGQPPGNDYTSIGYGLFQAFRLKVVK